MNCLKKTYLFRVEIEYKFYSKQVKLIKKLQLNDRVVQLPNLAPQTKAGDEPRYFNRPVNLTPFCSKNFKNKLAIKWNQNSPEVCHNELLMTKCICFVIYAELTFFFELSSTSYKISFQAVNEMLVH